jgi:hypothetical protein
MLTPRPTVEKFAQLGAKPSLQKYSKINIKTVRPQQTETILTAKSETVFPITIMYRPLLTNRFFGVSVLIVRSLPLIPFTRMRLNPLRRDREHRSAECDLPGSALTLAGIKELCDLFIGDSFTLALTPNPTTSKGRGKYLYYRCPNCNLRMPVTRIIQDVRAILSAIYRNYSAKAEAVDYLSIFAGPAHEDSGDMSVEDRHNRAASLIRSIKTDGKGKYEIEISVERLPSTHPAFGSVGKGQSVVVKVSMTPQPMFSNVAIY